MTHFQRFLSCSGFPLAQFRNIGRFQQFFWKNKCIISHARGITWVSSNSILPLLEPCHRKIHHSPACFEQKTEEKVPTGKLKKTGQLAKVFAEYGTTAVVFHTTISLTSLGICYAAVSSGIDVVALLRYFNLISEVSTEAKIAGGAGTFVIAYACHKVFMPVRIFMTVTCTPIVVRKLRSMGLIKNPNNPT